MSPNTINRMLSAVKRLMKEAAQQGYISHELALTFDHIDGVKPHDLRRCMGTQLAKVDIRKAQKALGHKRIDTTARHYVLDDIEVGLTDHLY